MKNYLWLIVLIAALQADLYAQDLKTNISVHDPVMIKQDSTYYLFATGRGINMWSSRDMLNWKSEKRVFDVAPKWAVDSVRGFNNHIWAPDISYYHGKYYLYYSVSTFGKNNSCIGVATNVTLHPDDPAYQWLDHGLLVQSKPEATNWNAIDANMIIGTDGLPYLAFGSFWEGIKIVKLKQDGLSVDQSLSALPTLARRQKGSENAIEAPFIFKKADYFYLFCSIDYCCKGAASTYKMIVGRSKNILGPYLDEQGLAMNEGGGTPVLAGNADWHGVGHNAVCTFGDEDYLIFHGYDAKDNGRSKLLLRKLSWEKGWPRPESL